MGVFSSAMLSSWHPSVPQQPEPKKERKYINEYLYIQYKYIQYIYCYISDNVLILEYNSDL